MAERVWRLAEAVRFGFLEFLADHPPRILLTTAAPRVLLQCYFYVLIGRLLNGSAGMRFAFIGIPAAVSTLSTAVAICDVPIADRWAGTFHRVRTGGLNVFVLLAARCLPHVAQGFVSVLLALFVIGPAMGLWQLSIRLIPLLPLYALMTLTGAAAGLAVGVLAASRRVDVLLGNLLSYLILLGSGAVVPPRRVPWVSWVGTVLPIRHGLEAVRARLDGGSWSHAVIWEMMIGIAWGTGAWASVRLQLAGARRRGGDDFI